MNNFDKEYHTLLQDILDNGTDSDDRTGVSTKSVFGKQMRFDLTKGFPLITTKKIHWKSVVGELLWILSGSTNAKELKDKYGISIWDEWADVDGNLGPIYGKQLRNWDIYENKSKFPGDSCIEKGHIDQIFQVINKIKTNPNSRRLVVSAWNVADLDYMALNPCHALFQFYVRNGKLSCHLYQRSGDAFLGVPFNIASYALLTHMIAQVCGLEVGEFIHSFGDVHIYKNHVEQVNEQLSRGSFDPPKLKLNPLIKDIDLFTVNDIMIEDYKCHPAIKAEVAV